MEDLGTVSFSNKENFHKFMDIALSEHWECLVRADCEGVPMVEFSPTWVYGGPYAVWHSETETETETETEEEN